VYLRPHKTGLEDAQQHTPVLNGVGHCQIYNGHGCTAAVEIPRDVWFHVRLVVTGAQAQLYVSSMAVPSLVMNDLKTGIRQGGVGFYGVHVSNVEIRRMPPADWGASSASDATGNNHQMEATPSMDALERDLEGPLSKSGAASTSWQEVRASPPGFVVINRYLKVPI
jgi:primosomal replication protein N